YLHAGNKDLNDRDFKVAIKDLQKKKLIKHIGDEFSLMGYKPVNAAQRHEFSLKHIKAARGVAEYLARVPWVQFIGVTGSVAACNALKKDDIDLIIICKKNRAWISRF